MTAQEVRDRVAEFAALRPDPGEDSVAQVEAALFIEEVFGLSLTDDDLCSEVIGSHQAILHLVLDRLGVR